ncbi:MAG: hypothetical protein PHQ43_01500 [Dehalococcoidales bacterium]|nr:hypothetical protein [Dehalococcoidales bacterium]
MLAGLLLAVIIHYLEYGGIRRKSDFVGNFAGNIVSLAAAGTGVAGVGTCELSDRYGVELRLK